METDFPLLPDEREEYLDVFHKIEPKHCQESEIIQFFYDVIVMIAEVESGGIYQYLTGIASDRYVQLLDQALDFDFEDVHTMFTMVLGVLDADEMPEDRKGRIELLDSFGDGQWELFEEADRFFRENVDAIERQLYDFLLTNENELSAVLP